MSKQQVLNFRTNNNVVYGVSLAPDSYGHIVKYGPRIFALPHPEWVFKGLSKSHLAGRPTTTLAALVTGNLADAIGGYPWDSDHGDTRRWNLKITQVWVEEVEFK